MKLFYACVILVLLKAGSLSGADLSGRYDVTGSNPGGKGSYTGTALIERNGDSYRVAWKVGTRYVGTGIAQDDYFSVAYTDSEGGWFGIVIYRIVSDGSRLEGRWCGHGGSVLGKEILTKKMEETPE